MQLHSHWDTVSRHPHLDGWIYRVAINRAKDYRRSLARAARLVERIGREPVTTSPSEPWRPEFEFVQALRTLPKQQRVAAALYYAADLPLHEVAGSWDLGGSGQEPPASRASRAEGLGGGRMMDKFAQTAPRERMIPDDAWTVVRAQCPARGRRRDRRRTRVACEEGASAFGAVARAAGSASGLAFTAVALVAAVAVGVYTAATRWGTMITSWS